MRTTRLMIAKTIAIAAATVCLTSAAQAQRDRGDWKLYYDADRERIEITFSEFAAGDWQTSRSFPVDSKALEGLTIRALQGPTSDISFRVRRDAGTFTMNGTVGSMRGRGSFDFAPNAAFVDELTRRGYSRPTGEQQFQLALNDVGLQFIDELRAQGYERSSVSELVRMGQHGVNYDFVHGLALQGYKLGDTDDLVRMRDHGVTPGYIEALHSAGYTKIDANKLVEMRDHGVSADFIAGMRAAGFKNLDEDELIRIRDHGVSSSYISGMNPWDTTCRRTTSCARAIMA